MNTAPVQTIPARGDSATGRALQPPHRPEQFATPGSARAAEQLLAEAQAARANRCTVADYARFAVVAVYLASVLAWLVLSRQIRPNFSIRRSLWAFLFRQRAAIPLTGIVAEGSHCYKAAVNARLLSDAESVSRLRLFENGVPLAHPHSDHTAIRQHGGGRYSHWNGVIYFASSDNSDPRTNGRRYVYKEV